MGAVLIWVRHELRRRWGSLLVLAVLVALASGTIAASFAGAVRGGTALDRLIEESQGMNALIPANPEIVYPWDEFDRLPYVEARAGMAALAGVEPIEPAIEGEWLTTPADDQWFRTIDVPVVLEGRAYDPDTPDELVIDTLFAETYDLVPGDTVTVQLPTPREGARAMRALETVEDPSGRTIEWHVVGIVRSLWMTPEESVPGGKAALSPATLTTYGDELLGGVPLAEATIVSIFRLQDLDTDIAALTADARRLSGQTDVDVWNLETKYFTPGRDSLRFEARTLAAFGVAALLSAMFLLGGMLARASAAVAERLEPGPAVGMAPVQMAWAAALPTALAGLLGSGLGFAGAWLASGWFPVGSASEFEPAPGREIDWVVLPLVAGCTAVFCAAVGFAAAWRHGLRRRDVAPRPVSKIASWLAQASAPVPVVMGTRLALEPQRGRDAVPVRPAQVGAIAAVAGTIAALVFAHGVDDAVSHPERFGQIQQAETFVGFGGQTFADSDALVEQLRELDYVSGFVDARQGNATVDGGRVAMIVYSGNSGPKAMAPVVIDGRVPETDDEILVGTGTAEELGADIGDTIAVTGSVATRELTVVGTGFLPPGAHNGYTTGSWVADGAYPRLFDDFHFHTVLVASDTLGYDALAARLAADTGMEWGPPYPLDVIKNLESVRRFPAALAAFLALLGIGVVANALVLAVRRREGDLAIVRAVGMTGGQAAATIAVQALTLVGVGLLYGAPLGLVLGRFLWRTVAELLPLQYVPPASLWAILLVIGVSLGLTVLLAVLPARRAARIPIAAVLRAE